MVAGGLCDSVNAAWSGKNVLCERGTITFADKVTNVQNSGGKAAVVYNNAAGFFSGTLNGASTSIPSVSTSQENGVAIKTAIDAAGAGGVASTVAVTANYGWVYEAWDGTSMATPHASGVAALVWSNAPACTNAQVRTALQSSAKDLGAAGRDTTFGFGLVAAKDALAKLQAQPAPCGTAVGGGGDSVGTCAALGASCNTLPCCAGSCGGRTGAKTCK